jgi:hypothetical protein
MILKRRKALKQAKKKRWLLCTLANYSNLFFQYFFCAILSPFFGFSLALIKVLFRPAGYYYCCFSVSCPMCVLINRMKRPGSVPSLCCSSYPH